MTSFYIVRNFHENKEAARLLLLLRYVLHLTVFLLISIHQNILCIIQIKVEKFEYIAICSSSDCIQI